MKVFVYGTLLKGLERQPVLGDSKYLGPALVQAELFDLGCYPGVREGNGTVVGELYEVKMKTIERLDRIEGYDARKVTDSLFVRKQVEARKFADGERVNAFCYFYNRSAQTGIIAHGDYRRHMLEKQSSDQWLLAYGSNLSRKRLSQRVGEAKDYKSGYIDGFRLVFNKKAFGKQTVFANIAYVGGGERCPAVAYRLSAEQIGDLDRIEGVPDHYLRISVLFCDRSGGKSICQVYIAHPDRLMWDQEPETDYIAHIRRGYEEHGFDKNYLKNALEKG